MKPTDAAYGERELLNDLSAPDQQVIDTMSALRGDLLLLGAGGKIGHGLALMARRAIEASGNRSRVIAVSRFSDPSARCAMEADGINTIQCDLADHASVRSLPDAKDIIYLAGQKFGTASNSSLTWALNCYVPGVVAQRWPDAHIVFYSSGNVYAFTDPSSGGSVEKDTPGPVGEYAQSVLGRERVFEHFSRLNGTRMTCVRLSYACEPRYGVLLDIAQRIMRGQPVELSQGYVNIVWQTDCNRVTLKCLQIVESPPAILNLSGPMYAVKDLATGLAKAMGKTVTFTGQPAGTALLSNSSECWSRFDAPSVVVREMIGRVTDWVCSGGSTMGKLTHFETRDGRF